MNPPAASPQAVPPVPAAVARAAYVLVALFFYVMLVAADWGLARYLQQAGQQHRQATQGGPQAVGEAERQAAVRAAMAEGYKPSQYPQLFNVDEDFRALARKHGIAPLAPQPASRVILCDEGYGLIRYTTDRFGFRNPDALWEAKQWPLLLIGDSFAQGTCVQDEQTISAVLTARGLSTLNLGTRANGPIHYAALAQVFAPVLRPRVVATIYYANDNQAGQASNEEDNIYKALYLQGRTPYFENPGAPPAQLRLAPNLLALYREADERVQALLNPSFRDAQWQQRGAVARVWETVRTHAALPTVRRLLGWLGAADLPYATRLALDTALDLCKAQGCEAVFVWIPNSSHWDPDPRAQAYGEDLARAVRAKGARFIDTTATLAPLGLRAYAPRGGHLSPEGYRIVAAQIEAAVRSTVVPGR